ncbi:MAG: uroporphyrinogen-III synthase [Gammaproteobacteria bacterium]|nr:uroporphyrinogen-III synthase [Gammaproteobacteria bacterium]MCB1923177.1 uroporphyrinogen-III synthase [Gammaproteobacteria bacterium]
MIEQAHGRPVRFPAMEILGPADKHATRRQLDTARHADLLIFVSANAVQYAFPLLPDQLPFDIDVAAVGNATARALADVGLDPTLVPQRMDSEGLLALPALRAVQGKRAIVLRGNGGRELLAETLRERGAEVMQVEVYRRSLPDRPAAVANLISHWLRLVQVVTASSNAILDNLFTLLGDDGAELLRDTPLVVVSQRMAEHATTRGCRHVHVASAATDAEVLAALCEVNEDVA